MLPLWTINMLMFWVLLAESLAYFHLWVLPLCLQGYDAHYDDVTRSDEKVRMLDCRRGLLVHCKRRIENVSFHHQDRSNLEVF